MLLSRQPSLLRRHNVRPVCRMMEECRERVVMAFPNADITRAIFAHILKSWFPKYSTTTPGVPWHRFAEASSISSHFLPFLERLLNCSCPQQSRPYQTALPCLHRLDIPTQLKLATASKPDAFLQSIQTSDKSRFCNTDAIIAMKRRGASNPSAS
jgi:hypothetical protein